MSLTKIAFSAISAVFISTAADANTKFVSFSVKRGSTDVSGMYLVNGYSTAEMTRLMRKYCKGGKVGQFVLKGKPRKKRGVLRQKFETTCAGGLPDRFKGKRASFEIELVTEGDYKNKHLVEILTSDGAGNIIFLKETTKP